MVSCGMDSTIMSPSPCFMARATLSARRPTPYGAFYTVAELPVEDAEDFVRWMLNEFRIDGATTMVTPAASFYKTPGVGRNHVRIAYVLEVPALRKALTILAEGLAEYQKLHPDGLA